MSSKDWPRTVKEQLAKTANEYPSMGTSTRMSNMARDALELIQNLEADNLVAYDHKNMLMRANGNHAQETAVLRTKVNTQYTALQRICTMRIHLGDGIALGVHTLDGLRRAIEIAEEAMTASGVMTPEEYAADTSINLDPDTPVKREFQVPLGDESSVCWDYTTLEVVHLSTAEILSSLWNSTATRELDAHIWLTYGISQPSDFDPSTSVMNRKFRFQPQANGDVIAWIYNKNNMSDPKGDGRRYWSHRPAPHYTSSIDDATALAQLLHTPADTAAIFAKAYAAAVESDNHNGETWLKNIPLYICIFAIKTPPTR